MSEYYIGHGDLTDPKGHAVLLEGLPAALPGLCRTVQGLFIHDHFGLLLYGPPPADLHLASRETLPVSRRVDAILAARDKPDLAPRPPFERSVGTCRDYALMLCAMLRQQSVPARVRCGFARYFNPSSCEDHWVCEYWKAGDRRWAIADAQLDDSHRSHLSIEFDAADVPSDQFVFPWRAWHLSRSGSADPAQFGHGSEAGMWFVQVNLARDLFSLCKREVSAWDTWRDARDRDCLLDSEAAHQCDRMAALAESAKDLSPPDVTAADIQRFLSPPWQC